MSIIAIASQYENLDGESRMEANGASGWEDLGK
jgi:hypothetical protein